MPAQLRKDRVHLTGASNRTFSLDGPRDFDVTMRSNAARKFNYYMTDRVPIVRGGHGNRDFLHSLPGFFFRFPGNFKKALNGQSDRPELADSKNGDAKPSNRKDEAPIIRARRRKGEQERSPRPQPDNVKPVGRWKARHWWEAPPISRHPLKKEEGETWNAYDSLKPQSERKGQDSLMRAVRNPVDENGDDLDAEEEKIEFFKNRNSIDIVDDQPSNDWEIRPKYLPEFAHKIKDDGTVSLQRVSRIQTLLRARYSGRPSLLRTFLNYSLTKRGYMFPEDLQLGLGKMGIQATLSECKYLVSSVDRDSKGAMSFKEFADFVYADNVVAGGPEGAAERKLRHVTKNLADLLVSRSPQLGTAFCNMDPERNYLISKSQFANALQSAVNHLTPQSIDFLWASQFPEADMSKDADRVEHGHIDWRSFMDQLATFASDIRMPTPCTLQGRKTNYDTLQRTVPITNGILPPIDLNRPDQDPDNKILLIAGRLACKEKNLASMPREAAFLTNTYVEYIQTKASRAQRALAERVPRERMEEIIKGTMTRDDFVDVIMKELEAHEGMDVLPSQEAAEAINTLTSGPSIGKKKDIAAYLRIERADVQAFISCEHVNKADHIVPSEAIKHIYTAKLPLEEVNDGLNRALRLNPPPRQRPAADEKHPRYGNHWQARYAMETIADALEKADAGNGGRLKSYKVFKRLDADGDGYVTISDMEKAMQRYQIPLNDSDVHALLTEMDPNDTGSIDLPNFTRHFGVFQGNLMDSLQKTVRGVYRGGGVESGGPMQDRLREQIAEAEKAEQAQQAAAAEGEESGGNGSPTQIRAQSEPPTPYSISSSYRDRGVYRTSDVIKRRTDCWKGYKHELTQTLPPSRFSRTIYSDTRHVTQPLQDPLNGSYMHESERFQTTYLTSTAFVPPYASSDINNPQIADSIRKNAVRESRIERIRQRQNEFAMRQEASESFARDYDERRIAHKALNKLNYERRVRMSCG